MKTLKINFSGRNRVIAEINNSGIELVSFSAEVLVTEKGFETLASYFSNITLKPVGDCPASAEFLKHVMQMVVAKFKKARSANVVNFVNPFFDIVIEVDRRKAA